MLITTDDAATLYCDSIVKIQNLELLHFVMQAIKGLSKEFSPNESHNVPIFLMYGVYVYQVCVCGTYFNKLTYKLAVSDGWARMVMVGHNLMMVGQMPAQAHPSLRQCSHAP